jgi:CO/xanthine dehydrogenase Mo-binding subunit
MSTDSLSAPVMPVSLKANTLLSQWLSVNADGTVTVRSGKVELGQGIRTALAQIVAQELDVAVHRVRMVSTRTGSSPNEGVTAGSLSVQDSGAALRQVCAQARAIYLAAAAQTLGLSDAEAALLEVHDGQIGLPRALPSQTNSYWALADDSRLACAASGRATVKPVTAGQSCARMDLPDKVLGQPVYIHDLQLPGMLYGRVVQQPSPAAQLESVDLAAARSWPGVVSVLRDGSFLGLVAESAYAADTAVKRLAASARWQEPASLPDMQQMPHFLRTQPVESTVVLDKRPSTPSPAVARRHGAAYSRPFLAHASIAPSCAVARYDAQTLAVWTHSQGVYNLRADLALVLGLPAEAIQVQHVDGAGCYGHNGADDVACDAALLARAVPGRPVQVQWSREDELGCAPFGAAMSVQLQAELDAQGRICSWQHEVWSTGHSMRPGRSSTPVLRAAALLEKPFDKLIAINMPMAVGGGAERNAVPIYDFAQTRAVSHRALVMPIRSSSLRSLGAHCNVFAAESFMDELALLTGCDPLEFRLRHLSDARARAVLQTAARMAAWSTRESAEGRGLGLAVTQYKNTGAYCAVVARIDAGHRLRVDKLWIAVDVGRVVNPDGVINQIEGGAIQTVSWVLKEQVQFDRTRILSNTWDGYPILKFSEVPQVEVELIDRPEQKSVGAGEATHGPVSAAIANAVADALGVRMRDMPIHADSIARTALADPA